MSNEMIFALGALAVGLVGFGLFAYFHFTSGVHASLSNARIGEVYNFDYEQPLHGEHKRVFAKVIEPVTTLDDGWIRIMNRRSSYRRNDPVFKRTNHLVTCEMPNGDVRQFYAERATNVRRSIFGKNLFKVAALFV